MLPSPSHWVTISMASITFEGGKWPCSLEKYSIHNKQNKQNKIVCYLQTFWDNQLHNREMWLTLKGTILFTHQYLFNVLALPKKPVPTRVNMQRLRNRMQSIRVSWFIKTYEVVFPVSHLSEKIIYRISLTISKPRPSLIYGVFPRLVSSGTSS